MIPFPGWNETSRGFLCEKSRGSLSAYLGICLSSASASATTAGVTTTAESAAKAAAVETSIAVEATTHAAVESTTMETTAEAAVEATHRRMMPHRGMMMIPHRGTMPIAVPRKAETPEDPKDDNHGQHFNALLSRGSVNYRLTRVSYHRVARFSIENSRIVSLGE